MFCKTRQPKLELSTKCYMEYLMILELVFVEKSNKYINQSEHTVYKHLLLAAFAPKTLTSVYIEH